MLLAFHKPRVIQHLSRLFRLMALSDWPWAPEGGLWVAGDGHWESSALLIYELLPLASSLSWSREWCKVEVTEIDWFIARLVAGSLSSSLDSLIYACKLLSTKMRFFRTLTCLWSNPASISRVLSLRSRYSALLSLGERAGLILMAGDEAWTSSFLTELPLHHKIYLNELAKDDSDQGSICLVWSSL